MSIAAVSFGGYEYDTGASEVIIAPAHHAASFTPVVPSSLWTGDHTVEGARVEVAGRLLRTSGLSWDDWHERVLAFGNAHNGGRKKLVLFGNLFLYAEVTAPVEMRFQRTNILPYSIEMIAADPGIYRSALITTDFFSGGTDITNGRQRTVDASGTGTNCLALPDFEFDVASIATGAVITIINRTLDSSGVNALKFLPDATGTWKAYHSLFDLSKRRRLFLSTNDRTDRLRGYPIYLTSGINTLEFTAVNCTVTGARCLHYDRTY